MSCNLILISWPLNSWSKPEHDELWLADWECLAFQPSHWTMGNQASRYRDDYSILYSSYSFENAIVLNGIFNRKSETKKANQYREYGKDGDLDPSFLFLFKIYITLAIFNISAWRGGWGLMSPDINSMTRPWIIKWKWKKINLDTLYIVQMFFFLHFCLCWISTFSGKLRKLSWIYYIL